MAVFVWDSPTDLPPGHWQDVRLTWDLPGRSCGVSVDGRTIAELTPRNDTPNGVCYLHLRSAAADDGQSLLVGPVRAQTTEPGAFSQPLG